ncbi:MAG: hypothetical protein HFI42_03005 [Lachnospiraceae bacterium]|nr:hypothetical protein [Lachnospiraceae bacterium]
MRKVTAEHLIDAIGEIDPAYVQEAEQWREQASQRKRAEKGQSAGRGGSGYFLRLAAAAACLLLVVGGAALALRNAELGGMSGGADSNTNGGPEAGSTESGGPEAGSTESGSTEAGGSEAGSTESGGSEAGSTESGSTEAGGSEAGSTEAGGSKSGAGATAGAGEQEGAGEALGTRIPKIPEEAAEVEVVHYSGGREDKSLAEGNDLRDLRAWMENLELGEPIIYGEGEAPVGDGRESYVFRFEGGELSYRMFDTCYLVVRDAWYPVQNPTAPPVL